MLATRAATLIMLSCVQNAIASRPLGTRLVFLSDYDGTLAEFHLDPSVPMLSAARRSVLADLSRRPDLTIGIVSGRRVVDLRTRTQLPRQAYLAGLHGMEIETGSLRWQHPDLDRSREHVRALAEQLEEVRDRIPGLLLEDKDVSLAVHVRGVDPELRDEAITLAESCAESWLANGQLRRLEGALVVEYLPNIACHKGDATQWIIKDVEARCGTPVWTVFVGDDVTDEDAFRAIENGTSVLVGSRPTSASHQLSNTEEVDALLRWLANSDNRNAT